MKGEEGGRAREKEREGERHGGEGEEGRGWEGNDQYNSLCIATHLYHFHWIEP